MIVYDIRVGDFIQLLSIFVFIGDVKHVSRSVSSISMMSYRRMSIGTITDRSMAKIMIIEKIQILKIDMDIKTILKDHHEKRLIEWILQWLDTSTFFFFFDHVKIVETLSISFFFFPSFFFRVSFYAIVR